MIKKIFLFILLLQNYDVFSYPGLQKINDDLYVAKDKDGYYFAMERIDSHTIDMWLAYANNQKNFKSYNKLKYLPNNQGSLAFYNVLFEYKNGEIKPENELWVAYISSISVKKKAELDVQSVKSENPTIEMFVSVITSSKALLTSHMGISRTWEAAQELESSMQKKYSDQSIHLHSFAAKVMKTIDPKKVYMLTIPLDIMRTLLIKKMPKGTVFIGDQKYQERLEGIEKDEKKILSDYDLEERAHESAEQREKRLKNVIKNFYNAFNLNDKIPYLKTNPARIIKNRENKEELTILNLDGKKPLISFDENTKIYQWLFASPYKDSGISLPYVLVDLDALANATKLTL